MILSLIITIPNDTEELRRKRYKSYMVKPFTFEYTNGIQKKRNLVSSVIGGDSQEPEVVAGNYK